MVRGPNPGSLGHTKTDSSGLPWLFITTKLYPSQCRTQLPIYRSHTFFYRSLPPRSLTARPWKKVVGRRSFPIGARQLFRGELLVVGSVIFQHGFPLWSPKVHLFASNLWYPKNPKGPGPMEGWMNLYRRGPGSQNSHFWGVRILRVVFPFSRCYSQGIPPLNSFEWKKLDSVPGYAFLHVHRHHLKFFATTSWSRWRRMDFFLWLSKNSLPQKWWDFHGGFYIPW